MSPFTIPTRNQPLVGLAIAYNRRMFPHIIEREDLQYQGNHGESIIRIHKGREIIEIRLRCVQGPCESARCKRLSHRVCGQEHDKATPVSHTFQCFVHNCTHGSVFPSPPPRLSPWSPVVVLREMKEVPRLLPRRTKQEPCPDYKISPFYSAFQKK